MAHVLLKNGSTDHDRTRELLQLAFFLILLQLADGCLTILGVSFHGVSMEGNLFLRYSIYKIGLIPTIALAKLAAILITIGLVKLSSDFHWVHNAIGGVSIIYLFAAIFPWTYFLVASSMS